MKKEIVVNSLVTPDGTRLISHHRHDYKEYTDKNGLTYMIDGGTDYVRYTVHEEAPAKIETLYFSDDIEDIRKYHCRGGRGKDGKQPLKWVPLCEMSNNWLKACVDYNIDRGLAYHTATLLYLRELDYRFKNNITIDEQ